MRTLNSNEINSICGGKSADPMTCTMGTDGVNCTASAATWIALGGAVWDLLAATPGTAPWVLSNL